MWPRRAGQMAVDGDQGREKGHSARGWVSMEPHRTTLVQVWDGWRADGNDPFRLARWDAGNRMDIVRVRPSNGARVGSEGFLLAKGMTKEW